MTGISTGHRFAERGMDNFIIIEAQDYIGGRTKSMPFGSKGIGINVGGSWISGSCYGVSMQQCRYNGANPTATNPMLTFALQYNLAFARTDIHEWNSHPPFINGTGYGEVISPALVRAEYEHWFTTQRRIDVLVDDIYSGWIDDMSYSEGLTRSGWFQNNLNLIQQTLQWNEFNLEFADNIHNYSLGNSELDSYYLYGNQDLLVIDPRGYAGITLELASDYLNMDDLDNEPKIALNSPIERIEYEANGGVTVYIQDSTKQYHAKYGLVTFSIGVLKSNPPIVQFSPPLPSWKQQAIDDTDFGHYGAVYIEWPNAFWSATHPEIDDNELNVLVDERYGYFVWFINLNHDNLIPGSLMWRFDITEELAIRFAGQDIETSTNELINDKLSLYWDIDDIPEPVSVFVGNWSVNPYVQG
eukprot:418042_1